MFALPTKAPKAKTASQATLTRAPKPPQRTPLRPGAGLSNQALLRLLQSEAQRAESLTGSTSANHQTHEAGRGLTAGAEAAPSASWDFSKIPVFAPNRPSGPEARPPLLQPKLTVGEVNDPLEHEADRVADQVMRMPAPTHSIAPGQP